jgi:hypothetical protein
MQRLNKLFTLLCGILLLAACKKEDYAELNKGNTPLVLSASSTTIQLKEKDQTKEAINLVWTTGSNQGTNASIEYTLQFAKQGTNFAAPVSEDLGKSVYNKKYTVEGLNDLLVNQFGAAPGVPITLDSRIIAATQADGIEPEIATPVALTITPYSPVTKTLYIIGDAAPNGWDNSKATPLDRVLNEPGGFRWTGQLKAGDFKFITTLGSWLPGYNKGATANKIVFRTDDSQPDDKFNIPTTAVYNLSVNLLDSSISIEKANEPPYSRIWIVGSATPNGWNIDNPNEMQVDSSNLFVFKYNEILNAGEFKMPVSTGNWGADFYMPATNHQPLTEQAVQLVPGGSPDNKWEITTAGAYKISLDLLNNKISIAPFTPYTQLWLVGDATPAGWNIDSPTPMVAKAGDPYTFTWEGALKPGEFKIPTATGNWGTDYFMPLTDQQGTSSHLAKFVKSGNPDHKWRITTAGNYRITINQLKETINIEKI